MPPQGNDTTDQGKEAKIGSLDAANAYESLVAKEKAEIAAKQAAEKSEIAKKSAAAKSGAVETSSTARAEILAAPGQPATPEVKPAAAPDRSPEKEELRYQNSLSKLGESSICTDLVSIIKKKAGDKVDQTAPDSSFSTLAASVMQNLGTLDADISKKSEQEKSGNFKPFRAIMEKWITQETASATADKIGRLRQVAETFKSMMDTIEKNEPTQPAKPTDNPAAAAPSGTESSSASAAPAEAKPEGFLGKFWDTIKGFFSKITDWFGGLFKKKDDSSSASTASTNSPAPAAAVNAPSGPPPQVPANPESLNGPDSTAGLKGQALLSNQQFAARTDQIAAKIGVNRADLYAIFKMESGANPAIQNPTSKATGLIQWMPKVAPIFGTSVDQLKQMTGLQQLDYVEKYFKPNFGRLHSFSDLYRAVFFPASIGKGPDYVFQTSTLSAQKIAQQNSGIDQDNGVITNASFDRYCAKRRPADSSVPLTTGSGNTAIA